MNAYEHARISKRKRGGEIEDYIDLHDWCDCSKEVEPSNKHRIYFHTMWGVKNCVMKKYGHSIVNSNNNVINVKDCCENDHILPDYRNKFIPTLNDFFVDYEDSVELREYCYELWKKIIQTSVNKSLIKFLFKPIYITNDSRAILITCNSWFLYEIFPQLNLNENFKGDLVTLAKKIGELPSPDILFENMKYQHWMSNGEVLSRSARIRASFTEKRKTKLKTKI